MPTIDISGPQGNAIFLIATAERWMTQMEYSKERINAVITQMESGDYDNLVNVFETEFKHVCTVVGKREEGDE